MHCDINKLNVGQGVFATDYNSVGERIRRYYLLIGVNDSGVKMVPVMPRNNRVMMHDESNDSRYADNVLLKDSPPPFSDMDSSDVYAVASMHSARCISFSEFERYNICISDDYAEISDSDLHAVLDHSNAQLQKELTYKSDRNSASYRELPYIDCDNSDDVSFDFSRF